MQLMLELLGTEDGSRAPTARRLFSAAGGVIGRGAGCDWVIPDASRLLSSHHGLVAYREGQYLLTDISSNGIGVAGSAERLRKGQARLISDGDVFQLGTLLIRAKLVASMQPCGEQWDANTGLIPDDAYLALDPIQALDVEQQRQTTSQDLEALADGGDTSGPWADDRVTNRDHLALPRRAVPAQEAVSIRSDAMPAAGSDVFWEQFATALGISLETLDATGREVLAIRAARLLRMEVEGLQQSLRTCEELKNEMNLPLFETLQRRRSPLRDSVETDAVMAMLLGTEDLGQLPAEHAITQAHRDMQVHQVALLAACRNALRTTRSAFAPGHLLTCFEYQGQRRRLFTDGGYWRAYQRHYQRLLEDEQFTDRLPGSDFAKAYEEQVRLISTLHVDYPG